MPSWRDSTTLQAQADLDELHNASLGFAQQQLADHGEFYPYAATIGVDGQTEMIASQSRIADKHVAASADMIEFLEAQLASRQHAIRAAAIIANVRFRDHNGNAIEVFLEHLEGQALRVLLPYAERRKAITYDQIRASADARRIWPHS